MHVARAALKNGHHPVGGALVEIDGEMFYRVTNYDAMPPFLMSLVSDSDHWLFISSNGALTAGRKGPNHALFPYYTDDRIHDGAEDTGSKTVIRVGDGVDSLLWEPFSRRYAGVYRVSRNLYKSTIGNKIIFEELNHDLALTFTYSWTSSERFGFVRRATLTSHASQPVSVELLDGVQNLLPAGIGRLFQEHYSTLVDGYKHNELDPETGLALLRLSSVPADAAEPSEALRTTSVWSRGLDPAVRLLSAVQLDRFRTGGMVEQETEVRGRRGAYLLGAHLSLAPGESRRWVVVAEVEQDAADVVAVRRLLRSDADLAAEVDADVRRGTQALVGIVASADGVQVTGDELSAVRHFSNTLFNVMRGGIPDDGYVISRDDFASYVAKASARVSARHAGFLAGRAGRGAEPAEVPEPPGSLPERLAHAELLDAVAAQGDPELDRLAHEYLPLTFSRRHGDPSRPWNDFAIAVKDEHGRKLLGYQGNWRDIFQNWEALAYSFPGYTESMIFKFLNASTADGHNPYRLTREGFDWEVLDPEDPWSYVGYWGDHQVIYLLKLLEVSGRFHPGAIEALLTRRLFTYADVPYRIKPYEALLADPRNTIDFDESRDRELRRRVAERGADGAFRLDADGAPVRVNLAEKLLMVALAKLANYVPEAGIWLNTQRPEWNDANNALVGYGVSMVTLYYLRRYLAHCRRLFGAGTGEVELSAEVATFFGRVRTVLSDSQHLLDGAVADRDRKRVLDALGGAASHYRSDLYSAGLSGERRPVALDDLRAFCDVALRHVDHSIRANRRADGLYHSYNLMRVTGDGIAVRHLYEMLEGQVAVLSSGALRADEAAAVLDVLRTSRLYRPDQNSYLLYPDRQLPRFLEKNVIPAPAVERSALLAELVRRGDRRIVVRDVDGGLHFNAAFRNAGDLRTALRAVADDDLRELVATDTPHLLDLYEEVFDHQSFTGRSGTFYKYEGLGCIYWHMVSKLLLAIHEVLDRAGRDGGADVLTLARIRSHYEAVRDGVGVHKSPQVHGAIPTDPYSHTPGFAGAQQPGMTGQVKEDIIARLGEMGLSVERGRVRFRVDLFRRGEFLAQPRPFRYLDVTGAPHTIELPAGTLGYTACQVPVVMHRQGPARLVVTGSDGTSRTGDSLDLDPATSAALFGRTGEIERLDVFLDLS
ncbi:MAG: hypothetical protein AUI14_19290 [Actinobacteria bacterium 13_2_20CM_2_71_6]|nr:MAG: hypothetical protein AUI14_19290 [Actinobacteria bacterium 13_2_20CM_2_71_6]